MSARSRFAKAMHLLFVLAFVISLVGVQPAQPVRADDSQTVSLVVAADTHMRSGNTRGSYNYGGSPTIRLNPYYQQGSDNGQLTGILLKWDLSSAGIPAGATVTAASLTFHVTDGSDYAYGLYNMRRAWVEGTKDGATGTGASWNYYGAGSGSWGKEGAQNTSSDRYDTNLWEATAAQFKETGSVTFDLNDDGLEVIQGWLDGTLDNYGLTIQNYSGSKEDVWEAASKEAPDETQRPKLNITYRLASTDPTIYTSGTLRPFSARPGVASEPQSYTVSGSNLEGAIEITALAGFQLSTDDSAYSSSLTLPHSGGSVSAMTVYVRLNSATKGDFSGDIEHTSAGATKVKVAVSGTVSDEICVQSRVSASADDAEERNDNGAVDPDGDTSTHSLQTFREYGGSSTGTLNWWGLRFQNVDVPQGATITSATITFRANANSEAAEAGMTLWGQLAANPGAFTTGTNNITSRVRTTASVSWSMSQWTSGSDYQTPDLAAIVQEIVGQPDWGAKKALVIIGQATATQNRSAISYDSTDGATLAPLLQVCYTLAPPGPTIRTSGTLTAFSSAPGIPSAVQSYTVSGSNLTEGIEITVPDDFEISLTSGGEFGPTISLPPDEDGTVESTTVYVRFKRATAGTSNGNITHTSTGAAPRDVSVTGTATAPLTSWIAYNDCAWASGQPETNITKYTIPGSGNTSTGLLVDYATGTQTPASVTITVNKSPTVMTGSYGGAETDAGTDAYQTFHGIVDMAGVIQYDRNNSGWYVDLAFSGLDPAATYTFATSANRNDSSYTRNSRFTLSGAEAAINASTEGVTVKSDTSVTFNTGYNKVNGYVARWTGIDPGEDGAFTVRVEADSSNEAYGPSVFMLGLEGEAVTHALSVGTDGNGTVNLSPPGGTYLAGSTVTLTPVPNAGFAFSHWDGANAAELSDKGDGTWSIVMDGDKSVEAHFEESLCTEVSLVASADTWLRNSQTKQNNGGHETIQVSPFTTYPQNALFRWDLSTIPAGATVSAASLTFHVTDSSAYDFYLYRMKQAWVEGTSSEEDSSDSANWETYDGVNKWATGGAEGAEDRDSTDLWDATASTFGTTGSVMIPLNAAGVAAVQGWVRDAASNHGLIIQRETTSSSADYWKVASKEADDEAQRPRLNITYCQAPSGPTIHTSGTLEPFSSAVGKYSAEQSYTVSGSNLTGDITITAPADFQVSKTSGSGFASSISLTPDGDGAVAETTIHVRFSRTAIGTSSGDITHTSDGATQRNIAVSGTAANQLPAVSLVRPASGATDISRRPTLEVQVTDPEADPMTVRFYGRPVGGGSGEEFTLVVIPDTQMAAQSYPTVMGNQFQWIADQYSAGAGASIAQNIVFVTSVGDIVNTSSSTTQYGNADAAYDRLDAAGVPYSVSPGNHDVALGLTTYFNDYFGPSRFQGNGYYQGPMTPGQNENNYSFFSAAGMDFIVINLTYNPNKAACDWADTLLKANPERRGIVVQHDILNTDNSWNNQTSYNELRDNPNLFLMLCGHMHTASDGSAYRAETGTAGQTIHIVQTDYQQLSSGNNDYLRLLRFAPAEDKIHASVYSPYVPGGYRTADPTEQFTMNYDMVAGSSAFTLIGTVTEVASGANASVSWPALEEGVEYEWYVEVSDGTLTTTSATWAFTTGEAAVSEHAVPLYAGWNLVSFNLQPVETGIADVLAGISGKYDLVYAWDAPTGPWRKYDPNASFGNTLTALDETMGFWIRMSQAATLTVRGQAPTSSSIPVYEGWNLVGYPSAAERDLPDALTEGDVDDLVMVLAFDANDGTDPWKLYDPVVVTSAPYANDLADMQPGWGYWVQVDAQSEWALPYQP